MKIKIKVNPDSSQQRINKISDREYEVWLKQKPVDGKANVELIKMMKKYLGKNVSLKSGISSKNKILLVKD